MAQNAQIPFDFFAPAAPSFDNFVVGDNAEALSCLYGLTQPRTAGVAAPPVVALWGGPAVGKSHLIAALAGLADTPPGAALRLAAGQAFPADPFVAAHLLCVDDADRLTAEQQAWLFTAFNHVVPAAGTVVVSGRTPPAQWPLRDDLRTRLGSGLTFEIVTIPQDELSAALAEHALRRGFSLGDEVLTYILSHSQRDVASLWQIVGGIDALSLALKRPVTVPLLREFLARKAGGDYRQSEV